MLALTEGWGNKLCHNNLFCNVYVSHQVLMAWYSYMLQRRQKKLRITEAMQRRRCHLIKKGMTQWLSVADDLSAMRKQFAVQQQARVCSFALYNSFFIILNLVIMCTSSVCPSIHHSRSGMLLVMAS